MTRPAVLDVAALAARAGVPADWVWRYAERDMLPAAQRSGDRIGYQPQVAHLIGLLAGLERLGITPDNLAGVAVSWRTDDCAEVQQTLRWAIADRLATVQNDLARNTELAAGQETGTDEWADTTRRGVTLSEQAARLQAATGALTSPHAGPCGDTCLCGTALTTPATRYHFPVDATANGQELSCDLAADDGDMHQRITTWQEVFAKVQRRDAIPGDGLALRFPLDADLAATLARLVAAEYRCCSFGSYSIVVDGSGLRLEVRLPPEAAGQLAAIFGTPHTSDAPAEGELR